MKKQSNLLKEAQIRQHVQNQNIDITVLETTTSTNDYFKDKPFESHLQVCLAEQQTAGRGRFQRNWVAPFGANILMSCRTEIQTELKKLGMLSLCVGLAIIKVLENFGVKDLGCKWPNDIVSQNQKLAGILIENQGAQSKKPNLIIGIGLNVNMTPEMLASIDRPTTSLEVILGKPQDRNLIAAALIDRLVMHLIHFQNHGFADCQAEWQKYDILYNQEIILNLAQGQVIGIAKGVDATGQLLLELPSGELKTYSAGETSLHKKD